MNDINQESLDMLTEEDLELLDTLAHERPADGAPLASLARLEKFGLLMRRWGQTFVVTRAGCQMLAERAAA